MKPGASLCMYSVVQGVKPASPFQPRFEPECLSCCLSLGWEGELFAGMDRAGTRPEPQHAGTGRQQASPTPVLFVTKRNITIRTWGLERVWLVLELRGSGRALVIHFPPLFAPSFWTCRPSRVGWSTITGMERAGAHTGPHTSGTGGHQAPPTRAYFKEE